MNVEMTIIIYFYHFIFENKQKSLVLVFFKHIPNKSINGNIHLITHLQNIYIFTKFQLSGK